MTGGTKGSAEWVAVFVFLLEYQSAPLHAPPREADTTGNFQVSGDGTHGHPLQPPLYLRLLNLCGCSDRTAFQYHLAH